jgi:hypothetical protein
MLILLFWGRDVSSRSYLDEVRRALFFQKQWDILGDSIFNMIDYVFRGGTLDPEFHRTFISLIPKVDKPESF